MKISASVKCICKACKIIKRNNTVYVYCTLYSKHKQRQG